jgi:predicted signal transduction protein with EAL and GGDEF domain
VLRPIERQRRRPAIAVVAVAAYAAAWVLPAPSRPGCLAVAVGLAWLAGARLGGLLMGAAVLAAPVAVPVRIGLAVASALGGELLEREARAGRELRARSFTDRLTGLRNYDFFSEALDAELARVRRYGGCTTLVLIDLDRFKAYNDRHGHGAGNRLLASSGAPCSTRSATPTSPPDSAARSSLSSFPVGRPTASSSPTACAGRSRRCRRLVCTGTRSPTS